MECGVLLLIFRSTVSARTITRPAEFVDSSFTLSLSRSLLVPFIFHVILFRFIFLFAFIFLFHLFLLHSPFIYL